MNKLYFSNLGFEITRRCNMPCPHCLRGEAQNKDIDFNYIKSFLQNVAFIGSILITGGEPALNIEAMEYILFCCKKFKIPVLRVYISSNGLICSDRFIKILSEWTNYCHGNTAINITRDEYHLPIPKENLNKFGKYKFIGTGIHNFNNKPLYNLGKAKNIKANKVDGYIDNIKSLYVANYNSNYYIANYEVLVNCNGNIILAYFYEYDDEEKVKFCNYNEFYKMISQKGILVPMAQFIKAIPPFGTHIGEQGNFEEEI